MFETLTVIAACHALQIKPSVLLSVESNRERGTPAEIFEEYGEEMIKAPFSLSAEQRNRIIYSETPLSISLFVTRLNGLRPDPPKTETLPYRGVVNWLMENGYLEVVPSLRPGGYAKAPTAKGKAIGISWERRHRGAKEEGYMVTLYNAAAQRFIVSNLDEILSSIQQKS